MSKSTDRDGIDSQYRQVKSICDEVITNQRHAGGVSESIPRYGSDVLIRTESSVEGTGFTVLLKSAESQGIAESLEETLANSGLYNISVVKAV